jgi:hypothetical protein
MVRPASPANLRAEFDAFLFSSIGEDRNGMPLSVVSFLARHDLDPWLEAASLAELPAEAATRKLTKLIQTIAYQPLTLPDAGAIATRLIALLPRRPRADIQQLAKPAGATAAALTSSKAITAVVLIAIFLILMLGSQFVMSRHAPSTQPNAVHAPVAPHHPATGAPLPSGK